MKTIALTVDGRQISAQSFISGIRNAKANPKKEYKQGFNWFPETGEAIVRRYHKMINDKINERGGLVIRELKDLTWYRRAQMLLNGNFVVREHDLPLRIRKRFESRIYRGEF
jgi:hypothetical protein